jgi:hypothetical protein
VATGPATAALSDAASLAAAIQGPHLAVPFGAEPSRAPVWVAVIVGPVTGAVAAAIATPTAGLAVGVATIAVLLVPRLRILLGLAAIAGIVAAGWYTAAHQAAAHVPANGSWPLSFGTASTLAWAGVVFLGADGVVEAVLGRRRRRPVPPEPVSSGTGPLLPERPRPSGRWRPR